MSTKEFRYSLTFEQLRLIVVYGASAAEREEALHVLEDKIVAEIN